ncbi:MAG TPA: 16S rRNA (guanine(966)-N(2))-methyltransferase RsmD, partial [Gammaproteobacteria bacterium]
MGGSRRNRSKPGFVRIIGGTWRRRRITIPAGLPIRPTPDRVRETVFNWLGPLLPRATCLDLYAGSGVLGFEALSRGAGCAGLVERDAAAAAAMQEVCAELSANAEIVCADAAEFLERTEAHRFDVAFVDPPYATDVGPVIEALIPALSDGARVYLERDRGDPWPELSGLRWVRRGAAG